MGKPIIELKHHGKIIQGSGLCGVICENGRQCNQQATDTGLCYYHEKLSAKLASPPPKKGAQPLNYQERQTDPHALPYVGESLKFPSAQELISLPGVVSEQDARIIQRKSQGLTINEIAQAEGLTREAVKKRLQRARAALKQDDVRTYLLRRVFKQQEEREARRQKFQAFLDDSVTGNSLKAVDYHIRTEVKRIKMCRKRRV